MDILGFEIININLSSKYFLLCNKSDLQQKIITRYYFNVNISKSIFCISKEFYFVNDFLSNCISDNYLGNIIDVYNMTTSVFTDGTIYK